MWGQEVQKLHDALLSFLQASCTPSVQKGIATLLQLGKDYALIKSSFNRHNIQCGRSQSMPSICSHMLGCWFHSVAWCCFARPLKACLMCQDCVAWSCRDIDAASTWCRYTVRYKAALCSGGAHQGGVTAPPHNDVGIAREQCESQNAQAEESAIRDLMQLVAMAPEQCGIIYARTRSALLLLLLLLLQFRTQLPLGCC
jgi:hypothetical protein